MSIHPQAPAPSEPVEVPQAISRLTNREADQMLAQAETARRSAIDEYWSLCLADPVSAAQVAAGSPTVVRDLALLASCSSAIAPRASSIAPLVYATSRLLAVRSVRNSLATEHSLPPLPEDVDAFWEDSSIVALKLVNDQPVIVLRYFGPMFNPGTVPPTALTDCESLFMECHTASDGNGGEIEFLTAYVIGTTCADGSWRQLSLDLASRSALMRDLKAMETLTDQGSITDAYFDVRPLLDFPTGCDHLIAQLNVHKTALRHAGAMSPEWESIVETRTSPLRQRLNRLQKHMERMEDEMYRIRCRVTEVGACALEEETGFARGDTIRHRSTGHEGVLEIVSPNVKAQFRLCGTTMYVTEDIRRGEWELVDPSSTPLE